MSDVVKKQLLNQVNVFLHAAVSYTTVMVGALLNVVSSVHVLGTETIVISGKCATQRPVFNIKGVL
jgi:hypothetical protein